MVEWNEQQTYKTADLNADFTEIGQRKKEIEKSEQNDLKFNDNGKAIVRTVKPTKEKTSYNTYKKTTELLKRMNEQYFHPRKSELILGHRPNNCMTSRLELKVLKNTQPCIKYASQRKAIGRRFKNLGQLRGFILYNKHLKGQLIRKKEKGQRFKTVWFAKGQRRK